MKTVRMLVILVLVLVGLVGIEAQGVEVYPTGNPAQDVPNIQNAVDLGGNVLLKATDTDGNPQYFNFGDFGIVGIEKDVVIMGESISETTYPTLPDGMCTREVLRSSTFGLTALDMPAYSCSIAMA